MITGREAPGWEPQLNTSKAAILNGLPLTKESFDAKSEETIINYSKSVRPGFLFNVKTTARGSCSDLALQGI